MESTHRAKSYPSVGPATCAKLDEMGIMSYNQLKDIGAEQVFMAYYMMHGGREHGMCSCLGYQFEGIIQNCKRNEIPQHRKDEIKAYIKPLIGVRL